MSLLSITIQQAGYDLDEAIIQDIQFSINKGELVGLIGANGAGKSTTIKSILGLIPHFHGEIIKKQDLFMSYLPERPVFYDELTFQEHIDFVAALEHLSDDVVLQRIGPLLNNFQMAEHLHELPTTFSKGMQQKAMIILALLKKPELFIIDEPFIGLDPIATKLLLDLIQNKRKRGIGILMCTHVLDTAEKICDRFIVLNNGKMIVCGTLEEIRDFCHLPNSDLFDCYHYLIKDDENE
ncbi:ABC-2 type transport system ATP-binding protein [Oikeobacillus pervagus]|uniref:ABC-2 type transport system ATP-binding protein n=1 Tax=Oikeobacillus pervagus TaxID=1325931 RepID=A0AAJ1SZB2_9BACI|nr:ABC transporter ATP-binding protein [Oikeobacillus pervagus]MDQ0215618.1 ABC-2 type transport system ATP-binding protein [Oikeobacillus pervagus]